MCLHVACELPVIASNTGGIPEIVDHGKSGLLSDVGDVERLARNTIHILNDENRYQQFRKEALEQAKRFELSKILPQYETYYEKILNS